MNMEKIVELDVRPILASGKDPFMDIMEKVKSLKDDETLLIINTFEPIPLYSVLGKKGYEHKTTNENGEWKIYFYKEVNKSTAKDENKLETPEFKDEIVELDVRGLEPPEPMIKILETLPKLNENTVLLVHHHREPLMLYDKLVERGYSAIANKIEENYFKIIITKIKE